MGKRKDLHNDNYAVGKSPFERNNAFHTFEWNEDEELVNRNEFKFRTKTKCRNTHPYLTESDFVDTDENRGWCDEEEKEPFFSNLEMEVINSKSNLEYFLGNARKVADKIISDVWTGDFDGHAMVIGKVKSFEKYIYPDMGLTVYEITTLFSLIYQPLAELVAHESRLNRSVIEGSLFKALNKISHGGNGHRKNIKLKRAKPVSLTFTAIPARDIPIQATRQTTKEVVEIPIQVVNEESISVPASQEEESIVVLSDRDTILKSIKKKNIRKEEKNKKRQRFVGSILALSATGMG